MEISAVAGVVLIMLGGLWPMLYTAKRHGAIQPLVVGLVAQGLVMIGLFAAIGLWAPDAIKYHAMGQEIAEHLRGGPTPVLVVGDGKDGFPNLLGGLYWAFGPHIAIGLAVNWVAHGALVTTLASVASRLALPVRRTAWVAALFPPLLLWGGLLLRESLAWLTIAAVALGLAIFIKAVNRRQYLEGATYALGGLLALTAIRGSGAIIIWVAAAITLAANARRTTILSHLALACAMLIVLVPQTFTILEGYLPDTSDEITIEQPEEVADAPKSDALTQSREALSRDASTSFSGVDGDGPPSMVGTSARIIVGPFPSEWNSVGLPFIADSALWLVVLGATGVGTWKQRKNLRSLLILILPALLLSGALIATSGNYGTMQRLRLQSTILLIPIAVSCVKSRGAATLSGPPSAPQVDEGATDGRVNPSKAPSTNGPTTANSTQGATC